jgi:hypothetical protein
MWVSYRSGESPLRGEVSVPVTKSNRVVERRGGERQEVKERFVRIITKKNWALVAHFFQVKMGHRYVAKFKILKNWATNNSAI